MVSLSDCTTVRSFVLACLSLLIASAANASFISIGSSSVVTVETRDSEIVISGGYTLLNEGDEIAYEVYPSFEMGGWIWSGKPVNLEPKSSHAWKFEERVPFIDLKCRANDSCAGLDLAVNGKHPMKVIRHYKDGNGYRFSAAEVQILTIGEVSPKQLALNQDEAVRGKLLFVGDGQDFTGQVELRNVRDEKIDVAMSFHAPREIQLRNKPAVVSLSREEVARREFEVSNFSGLDGSRYAVYVVLQWMEAGMRHTAIMVNQVGIGPAKTRVHLGWWLLLGVLIAGIPLYWFVFRRKAV